MNIKGSRILVVEDESDIRELLLLHLTRTGYEPTGAETGERGAQLLKSGVKWDLLVLDWMLPGISGIELCRLA
ncbi:MAG: response regulator, partial [Bdellovibrionota bacterium]